MCCREMTRAGLEAATYGLRERFRSRDARCMTLRFLYARCTRWWGRWASGAPWCRKSHCWSHCLVGCSARARDHGIYGANIVDNEAERRFELHADGEVSILTYRITGDRIRLIHTEVPRDQTRAGLRRHDRVRRSSKSRSRSRERRRALKRG